MTEEDQVASRIRLTPAERAVLLEQVVSLKVSSDGLTEAIKTGSGKEMGEEWVRMGEAMNYVGTILNMKGHNALRQYLCEQAGE